MIPSLGMCEERFPGDFLIYDVREHLCTWRSVLDQLPAVRAPTLRVLGAHLYSVVSVRFEVVQLQLATPHLIRIGRVCN